MIHKFTGQGSTCTWRGMERSGGEGTDFGGGSGGGLSHFGRGTDYEGRVA